MSQKAYPTQDNKQPLTVAEMDELHEKASLDLLRSSLKLSYKESFLLTTRLYKIQQMFSKAKITHKPFINK